MPEHITNETDATMTGTYTRASGGADEWESGASATFESGSTLQIDSGATMTVGNTPALAAGLTVSGGTVTVQSGAKVDIQSGAELEIDSGATVDANAGTATDSTLGFVELATDAETLAQADTARSLTPATLAYVLSYTSTINRPVFEYYTATSIYVGAGSYPFHGTNDMVVYWTSRLTSPTVSSIAANTSYYLYLDDSAIGTDPLITASELIWSTTAPTYSHSKRGHYNGNDMCIFGVNTSNGVAEIWPFSHDGGRTVFLDGNYLCGTTTKFAQDYNGITPGGTWDDVYVFSPDFVRKAGVSFYSTYVDLENWLYWRRNGSSDTTGHWLFFQDADVTLTSTPQTLVDLDSNGIFEVKYGGAGNNTLQIQVDSWELPGGM